MEFPKNPVVIFLYTYHMFLSNIIDIEYTYISLISHKIYLYLYIRIIISQSLKATCEFLHKILSVCCNNYHSSTYLSQQTRSKYAQVWIYIYIIYIIYMYIYPLYNKSCKVNNRDNINLNKVHYVHKEFALAYLPLYLIILIR